MVNRDMIKSAIDGVPPACFDGLYQIITAMQGLTMCQTPNIEESWPKFLAQTYGCMADAPIEHSLRDDFEKRESWS